MKPLDYFLFIALAFCAVATGASLWVGISSGVYDQLAASDPATLADYYTEPASHFLLYALYAFSVGMIMWGLHRMAHKPLLRWIRFLRFQLVVLWFARHYGKLEGVTLLEFFNLGHTAGVRILVTYPSAKLSYASTRVVGARWVSVTHPRDVPWTKFTRSTVITQIQHALDYAQTGIMSKIPDIRSAS